MINRKGMMMKKAIFMMLLATIATTAAMAQGRTGTVSVTPMVGGTLTDLVGKDAKGYSMKAGLVAGVELAYQVSPKIAISAGALYSMEGCKTNKSTEPKIKLEYWNVPLLANIYIARGLAVKAGLQPGFLVRARINGDGGIYSDYDIREMFHPVDLSVPIGLSYEVSNFVFDARYNFGLTKATKSSYMIFGNQFSDEPNNIRNSVFQFTLGYKIGL